MTRAPIAGPCAAAAAGAAQRAPRQRLGGHARRVVERTIAWPHRFRRLRVRFERREDIHEAFLSLAEALICWNALQRA
jgi:hypothetical protein